MAKKKQELDGGGNWMDTYGDMVTLLMTFFIAMYSMSSVQDDKWYKLVKAFNINGPEKVEQIVFVAEENGDDLASNSGDGNVGNNGTSDSNPDEVDFSDLYNYLKQNIEQNDMADMIKIEKGSTGDSDNDGEGTNNNVGNGTEPGYENIYIQFSNNVLFNPDESTLLDGSYSIMQFMGGTLKTYESEISKIIIKGYTANSPSSKVDERELSAMRATVISNYFEKTCNIESTQLIATGLGNDYPVASNDTEEGRSLNRRVEIVIIPKKGSDEQIVDWNKIFGSYFANEDTGDTVEIIGD